MTKASLERQRAAELKILHDRPAAEWVDRIKSLRLDKALERRVACIVWWDWPGLLVKLIAHSPFLPYLKAYVPTDAYLPVDRVKAALVALGYTQSDADKRMMDRRCYAPAMAGTLKGSYQRKEATRTA